MPEVKNCKNCKFEPKWRKEFTGLPRDRGKVYSHGCEYLADYPYIIPIGYQVKITVSYIRIEHGTVFWSDGYDEYQEMTDCPAHQPKEPQC